MELGRPRLIRQSLEQGRGGTEALLPKRTRLLDRPAISYADVKGIALRIRLK